MKAGFAKVDITPRVGVELCGFGPFLHRYSIAIRDRLWARAMAIQAGGRTVVLVSCDLIGVQLEMTRQIRRLVTAATRLPDEAIMIHCTHTHSGPNTGGYLGWGAPDEPYLEIVPNRIAQACINAVANLQEATIACSTVACEGIARNREYDETSFPLEEVLKDQWRPARPELTDTTCHVLKVETDGRLVGFVSSFGCHPVVCCEATRHIHGDYPGVATNMIERENPGSVGLFLQSAQGDINTCIAHQPEQESLLALDVIAARYARAVRQGMAEAAPMPVESVACSLHEVTFSRKPYTLEMLRQLLAEKEAVVHALDASDKDHNLRMSVVYLLALRKLIATMEGGESLSPPTELQGFRIGPLALLGAPFEVFLAIRRDVQAGAKSPTALVLGLTNDTVGYAPDRTAARRGGYATDTVPIMCGMLPYAHIHDELVAELLKLESALF